MKTAPSEHWLFDIIEAPVFATVTSDGKSRRIAVPNRKALIAADTGSVVGIVGSGYRVFTNREAVDMCWRFCLEAFADTKAAEWSLSVGYGPETRSWAALDILHRTQAMNLSGLPGGVSETYTPFVRVVNSYNGSRALRIDIGFMRKHCENGVIFERDAASIRVPHTSAGLAALQIARPFGNMEGLCKTFESALAKVRAVAVTPEIARRLVCMVVGWPRLDSDAGPKEKESQKTLDEDLDQRTERYLGEIGRNAFAAFNVMTDLAARPPESPRFRRDRPSLERRAGAWLRHFTEVSAKPDFDMERHLATYSPDARSAPPHQRMQPAGR